MINDLVRILEKHRDDENAAGMSAYMKNKFPFLGIKSQLRGELSKNWLKIKPVSHSNLWKTIHELWNLPEREYQYVAMEYLHRYRKMITLEDVMKIEGLITTKSWWDTVDNLASKIVGLLLLKHPDHMANLVYPWITSDDMWLNRAAIIFQLKYKDEVRKELLEQAIVPHLDSTEFFHAKAIGWALRQYSKYNPAWVQHFIENHEMQPLSHREATKYL